MRFAFQELKLVVEPGGAVGLAALLAGKLDLQGQGRGRRAVGRQCRRGAVRRVDRDRIAAPPSASEPALSQFSKFEDCPDSLGDSSPADAARVDLPSGGDEVTCFTKTEPGALPRSAP